MATTTRTLSILVQVDTNNVKVAYVFGETGTGTTHTETSPWGAAMYLLNLLSLTRLDQQGGS
jgi:hypothetical protein